jgi:DNA-binding transcriptional LysR family regulator
MVQLVRAGLGVAVLSRWAVRPYLDSSLAGVKLTPRGFYRGWSAVAPRGLAQTPYVSEFIRLVAANAPAPPRDVTLHPVLRPVRAIGA